METKYKNNRKPYKGEMWKILFSIDGGKSWLVHSEYTHSCFRDEAMKRLRK